MRSRSTIARVGMCLAVLAVLGSAAAQAPGLTIKPLLKTTYSDDASKDAIVASAELAPHATTGQHTHPGDEYGTVLEGELEVLVEGQEPRLVKAGESYHNAKGVLHESRNPGDVPTKLLSTFIVDKGKPLVQPAGK